MLLLIHSIHLCLLFFSLIIPRPPISTLFPYTTLFQSPRTGADARTLHPLKIPNGTSQRSHHTKLGHPRTERSEEHTSELQSLRHLVCRLLLEKKKKKKKTNK